MNVLTTYRKFLNPCSLVGLLLFIQSCSSEKVIDVDLPPYNTQMSVECYLEPGKSYQLTLQETVSYFSDTLLDPVANALVVITHNGISDTLANQFHIDIETGKIFNYVAQGSTVPYAPGERFDLYIRDEQGRELTGTTVMKDTVDLQPLELDINSEGEAAVTARWDDIPNEDSYYILTMHRGSISRRLILDFTLDDRIGDGEEFVVSSWYWMDPGDSCIATVYHVDQDYWAYINSIEAAEGANGNPFAQPAVIISNVEGGIGLFSCHPLVRKGIRYP